MTTTPRVTSRIRPYRSNAELFTPAIVFLLATRRCHPIALGVDACLLIGSGLALLSPTALRVWGEDYDGAAMLDCVLPAAP